MSLKTMAFYTGCVLIWVVVLPILAVTGLVALISYAIVSVLTEQVLHRGKSLDRSTARAIAQRMVLGH